MSSAFSMQRLGRRVLPLGMEVVRQVVVALSGEGVVVGEESAVDVQRLLVERLGRRVFPLGAEVGARLSVACGGGAVVVGE